MKLLFLDIETKATIIKTWKLYDITAGLNQIMKRGTVICWAAKWKDDKNIMFDSEWQSSHKKMIKHIWSLIDEADVVCHYNGQAFDMKELNRQFLLHDLPPPSPYKQLDLHRVVKSNFRFISNKLDNISQELNIGAKVKHSGMDLWNDVEKKDANAQKIMQKYNEQDTLLLEKLYNKLLPWLGGHINHNSFSSLCVCPACGSNHLNKRGYQTTNTQTYQRWRCMSCGSWSRSSRAIKNLRKQDSIINIR
jgi:uncharacterized protein YprB with RNaseH-like and TPR domain